MSSISGRGAFAWALAGAAALLPRPALASAQLDGAGLFALPAEHVAAPEPCEVEGGGAAGGSRSWIGQIGALFPSIRRIADIGVSPLVVGRHGLGLRIRGRLD
jgi:hypothetical protein